jgi:hypothetical protein
MGFDLITELLRPRAKLNKYANNQKLQLIA